MAFLVIIFICYFTVALIRKTPVRNEWLPLISGGLGLVLSLLAYFIFPSIVPSTSAGVTLSYGFFCGLAATGSNQVFKQAVKFLKIKYNIEVVPDVLDGNQNSEEK